jgi:uncharacterized protein
LPRPAAIEAYGSGGFRFAGMSHRGSLLCLPSGIWASPIAAAADIDALSVAMVFDETPPVELCLIGTGKQTSTMPQTLRELFRERHISAETMTTGAAVRTYNILLGENRRIAALLIAVD